VKGHASPPIGQPLSLDAAQRAVAALVVIDAQLGAVGISEVKFGQLAMQVLLVAGL
jgi:hypothetical protein